MSARFPLSAAVLILPFAIFFSFPTCGCSNGEATHDGSSTETTYTERIAQPTGENTSEDSEQTGAAGSPEEAIAEKPRTPDSTASNPEKQEAPGTGETTRPGTDVCGTITDEMIHQGEILFSGKGNCSTCHRGDATGSPIGPNLTDNEWLQISGDYPSIIKNIREGVPLPVEYPTPMPAMGGAKLNDKEVCELAAYVWSLSR